MKPVTIEYELEKEDIQKLDAVIGISCRGVKCPGCPMLMRKPFAGGTVCVKRILQIVKERGTNGD